MRRLFAVTLLLVGAGCGSSEERGPSFDGMTPANVEATATAGGSAPSPQAVVLSHSGDGQIYWKAEPSGAAVAEWSSIAYRGDPVETIVLVIFTAPGAAPEVRTSTIKVSACRDEACTSHLSGSPRTLAVTYTIGD